jgi:hypothetical protein
MTSTLINSIATPSKDTAIQGISPNGRGVEGVSATEFGVAGISDTSAGVRGDSRTGRGTEGWSKSGEGIFGISTEGGIGVYGKGTRAGFFEGGVVVTQNLEVKKAIILENGKDLVNWLNHIEQRVIELYKKTGHTAPPGF